MNIRLQVITTISFIVYLVVVLLTHISLTGFWTDVIFSTLLSILALRFAFKIKTHSQALTWTLRISNIFCSAIVFGLLVLNVANPFAVDTLKLRSFHFQSVDGKLFNAYFKPVGAYSGGYGNFWITQSPKYFPIVERRVYWERTVHHDFGEDTVEGDTIDNYQVVREYIRDEVIDKSK